MSNKGSKHGQKANIATDCIPDNDTQTVVELLGSMNHKTGEHTFFIYQWDINPAYCGLCGAGTEPDAPKACDHPERLRHVRGQIYVCKLSEFVKRHSDVRLVTRGYI